MERARALVREEDVELRGRVVKAWGSISLRGIVFVGMGIGTYLNTLRETECGSLTASPGLAPRCCAIFPHSSIHTIRVTRKGIILVFLRNARELINLTLLSQKRVRGCPTAFLSRQGISSQNKKQPHRASYQNNLKISIGSQTKWHPQLQGLPPQVISPLESLSKEQKVYY